MPIVFDHTSNTANYMNAVGPQLQQAAQGLIQYGMHQQHRMDQQRREMDRLWLADRDFAFRQQQADRGFEFQTQQAERQQGNWDRGFDQRQQLIDREIGQEDAAAEFYRGKLMEMFPGPVGGMDFANMDPATLKGIYEAERYQQELGKARQSAASVWQQVIGQDFGMDPASPMGEQVAAMIEQASTVEELGQVRDMAYKVLQDAQAQKLEAAHRASVIEQTAPMRAALQSRPQEAAAVAVLDRQFLNGDLSFKDYWTRFGQVMESVQGGGGDRPTAERLAYAKGLDAIATRVASGDLTEQEAQQAQGRLARMFGQAMPGGQPAPAEQRQASAPPVPPAQLQKAASFVAKKSPEQRREAAVDQALKLARSAGGSLDREAIADLAMQILNAANQGGQDAMSGGISRGQLSPANL